MFKSRNPHPPGRLVSFWVSTSGSSSSICTACRHFCCLCCPSSLQDITECAQSRMAHTNLGSNKPVQYYQTIPVLAFQKVCTAEFVQTQGHLTLQARTERAICSTSAWTTYLSQTTCCCCTYILGVDFPTSLVYWTCLCTTQAAEMQLYKSVLPTSDPQKKVSVIARQDSFQGWIFLLLMRVSRPFPWYRRQSYLHLSLTAKTNLLETTLWCGF